MRHYISSSAVSHKQKFSRIGNEHIVGFKHTCINKYFLEQAPGRSKTYPDVKLTSALLVFIQFRKSWNSFGARTSADRIMSMRQNFSPVALQVRAVELDNLQSMLIRFTDISKKFRDFSSKVTYKRVKRNIKIILYTYTCKRLKNIKIFFSP